MLDILRQHRALKEDVRRWAAMGQRFAEHFEKALGPSRMRALRVDACKDVRDAYVRATTAYVRAMNEADGSPDSVIAVNRASSDYLTAYRDALKLAAEMAEAGPG